MARRIMSRESAPKNLQTFLHFHRRTTFHFDNIHNATAHEPRSTLYFFKVAKLTILFDLPSSNRAARQWREARGIQPNLTYHKPLAAYRDKFKSLVPRLAFAIAPLGCR